MSLKIAAFADEAARPIEGQIAAMARNGISLLEIRFVGKNNISDLTPGDAREIRAALDGAGLGVWSIGSPTGKISLKDPFEPHFDSFRRQLDLAHILGADHYRLFSFYDADDTALDAVCERLERLLDAAKGSGVLLCHENEKKIYGDTAERCKKLLTALPALRAIFDPANFLQCGEDTLAAWEMLAPYVEYLHIKDCNADGKVVPPGAGKGNLREILKRYAAQGGEVVTLEPHLTAFIGLEQLENGERTESAYSFANGDEAFDAAAGALKKMIEEERL